MLVQTESDRWVIPPQRALWLPPLHIHSYHLLSQTDLRAIYFSSSLIAECTSFTKSQQVHVITATPLVKELIAGLFSEDYARPSQRKIALLLLEILSEAPPLTMALPMPNDERLFSAARSLLVNQRWEASLSELAFMSAMSERTFSRLFMKDTGFSFRTWKQRARICASLDLFGVGAALTFLLMLFFSPRNSPSFFAQPAWQLLGGVLGPIYVIILTVVTPTIGIAMTMIGILAGQVFKSLIIDHFGLLGTSRRKIDSKRIIALIFIIAALVMVAQG